MAAAVDLLESTKPTETMASGTTVPRTVETKAIYETTTTQEGTSMDETTVTNGKPTAGKEPINTQINPPFLFFRFTLSCLCPFMLSYTCFDIYLSSSVSCFLLLAL